MAGASPSMSRLSARESVDGGKDCRARGLESSSFRQEAPDEPEMPSAPNRSSAREAENVQRRLTTTSMDDLLPWDGGSVPGEGEPAPTQPVAAASSVAIDYAAAAHSSRGPLTPEEEAQAAEEAERARVQRLLAPVDGRALGAAQFGATSTASRKERSTSISKKKGVTQSI